MGISFSAVASNPSIQVYFLRGGERGERGVETLSGVKRLTSRQYTVNAILAFLIQLSDMTYRMLRSTNH